eukprot:6092128-Amphidinium_carterae.1
MLPENNVVTTPPRTNGLSRASKGFHPWLGLARARPGQNLDNDGARRFGRTLPGQCRLYGNLVRTWTTVRGGFR